METGSDRDGPGTVVGVGGDAVLVVGGANMDVKARSAAPLVAATSNPGRTHLSPGGVGRNIAENLARLGRTTRLVTVVGTDHLGDDLLARTAASGVDVRAVRRTPDHPTGTYTAVLDDAGELAVAVSSMAAVETLTPVDLPADLVAGAGLVVVDGNVSAAVVAHVVTTASACRVPVVLDPVSVAKAARVASYLGGLAMVTPNTDELTALAGTGDRDAALAALHARGVGTVWLRSGRDGSRLSTPDGTAVLASVPARAVDVTGAGDAMLAAYCHALLDGADPVDAARYGHAAAALTVATTATVHPDLSDDLVRSLL
ncbi:carbohydrate kinase family protein [Nocardioides sambongensis]|uniref:carbohydrate kinase family protein n=1 Tax=Nocardioides sambongensis TaxID=2589074 RepID=UPI001E4986E1|nr:carbohydrate kinase family protein [Nocardioides sambongensis]